MLIILHYAVRACSVQHAHITTHTRVKTQTYAHTVLVTQPLQMFTQVCAK